MSPRLIYIMYTNILGVALARNCFTMNRVKSGNFGHQVKSDSGLVRFIL